MGMFKRRGVGGFRLVGGLVVVCRGWLKLVVVSLRLRLASWLVSWISIDNFCWVEDIYPWP